VTRRDCLRIGGILGCALVSSVTSPFDAPGTPLVDLFNPDTPQSEAIDDVLTRAGLKTGDVPGAAVLVATNNNGILFQRGYGVTDLGSLHKIDSATNFRLASCTKQFTAMAIMLLVHDRKLRYEDRLTGNLSRFSGVWQSSQHSPSAQSHIGS
jgi:CubicO group peptidase (beta-lactamase class C family)